MRTGTIELIEKYGSRLAVAEAFLLDKLNALDQEEAGAVLTEELILGAKIRLEAMGKLTNLKLAGKAGDSSSYRIEGEMFMPYRRIFKSIEAKDDEEAKKIFREESASSVSARDKIKLLRIDQAEKTTTVDSL